MTADDLAGCAEVARSIAIPIATGENNYTRFEFRDLIALANGFLVEFMDWMPPDLFVSLPPRR